MKRARATKLLIIGHDAIMTALAVVLALALRFDSEALEPRLAILMPVLPAFLLMAVAVYWFFRLYQGKWRFASMPDVMTIAKAVAVLCIILVLAEFVALQFGWIPEFVLGRRVVILYWLVQCSLLAGPRFVYRYWKDRYWAVDRLRDASNVLLLGRGVEVEPIIRALKGDRSAKLSPVAILSPRGADLGLSIRDVPVEGTLRDLEDVVRQNAIGGTPIRRIIATPSALQGEPEQLAARVRRLGLALVRFEGIGAMGPATGPIEIEDLLSRPPVELDADLVQQAIRGRTVLVTGGGGSIGLEIVRSCRKLGAAHIAILENSEPAIYTAREALGIEGVQQAAISTHLCDIRDPQRLLPLMREIRPDIVFHAAALKQVPYLEQDWEEGIRTNTFGSVAVADAAIATGARTVVMISTDKAVQPVSILGVSKRAAEIAMEALDADQARVGGRTRLISVRFGNVLGSSGSVIPRFKAQIERGGPVTVTDKGMVRYFMTLTEAADLVVVAGAHAARTADEARSSVYVLRMGQPVRIYELAERMIRLSGYEPHRDIRIAVTGIRPGERLNEVLFSGHESLHDSGIEGVMAAATVAADLAETRNWLQRLEQAVYRRDREAANAILREKVADFSPQPPSPSLLVPPAPVAGAASPAAAGKKAPRPAE